MLKSHSEKDKMKLGGFSIFKERTSVKNDKTKMKFDRRFCPIKGEKYDLSYWDICEYFQVSQIDAERYLADYRANLYKGEIPSKKAIQGLHTQKTYSKQEKAKMSAQDKIFAVFDIERTGHRVDCLKNRQMYCCREVFRKLFPEEYYKIQKQDNRIAPDNKLSCWMQEQYIVYKNIKAAEDMKQVSAPKN